MFVSADVRACHALTPTNLESFAQLQECLASADELDTAHKGGSDLKEHLQGSRQGRVSRMKGSYVREQDAKDVRGHMLQLDNGMATS
eukprot:1158781-Pelagomonas_calceolata.AAC.6